VNRVRGVACELVNSEKLVPEAGGISGTQKKGSFYRWKQPPSNDL
jgi:hypothetical protein